MAAGSMTPNRPVVRWHGGKWRIAPWVIKHFPKHVCYTEAFGGGASVLLRKERAAAELYNDLDTTIVSLFRTLRDKANAAELIRLLELTPFAREEFDAAYERSADPIEDARRTIVRSFMGFGSDGTAGTYKTGFRATVTSSMKLPAQEWATYPIALRRIIERMQGVVIENRPAIEILERMDAEHTLHFVDPPYLPSTRSTKGRRGAGYHVYEHELSESDHVELLGELRRLKGMVVLSGYPSALYDGLLGDWPRPRSRLAHADGGRPRTEMLWLNPAAAARLEHGPLFA